MKWLLSCLLGIWSIAFVEAAEQEVPRVLILGDSIHRQMAQSAAKELSGRVQIVIPKGTPGDTGAALGNLDDLLGEGNWDLIYFNFGFADLHYRDPNTTIIRAMSKEAGGVRVTTPEQYEKNLREITRRLATTGARLLWSSTTPIESSKYDNLYDPGSEIEFNAIAARIMAQGGVPIIDMHGWVLENVKDKKDPSPFWFNRVPLHPPVVRAILSELKLPLPDELEAEQASPRVR